MTTSVLSQLMYSYSTGNNNAFVEIYKIVQPIIYKVLRKCLYGGNNNLKDLEDLEQTVFYKIIKSKHMFINDGKDDTVYGWVYGITINSIRSYFRTKKRRSNHLTAIDWWDKEIKNPELNLIEDNHTKQIQIDIYDALNQLEPITKEVIIKNKFEGISFDQLSKIYGLKSGTLRVRTFRGVQKMKQYLDPDNNPNKRKYSKQSKEIMKEVA